MMYDASPQSFRRRWTEHEAIFSGYQIALNDASHFITLFSFEYEVFIREIVDPVRGILNQTTYKINAWINDDAYCDYGTSTTKPKKLSVDTRMMRLFMFGKKYSIHSLEILYGQKKSSVYEDAFIIARVCIKKHKKELELPLADSPEYLSYVGAGILSTGFRRAVYLMDGHRVRIHRPHVSQRQYYSDFKGFHSKLYLYVHHGNGTVKYIHGGEPGHINDIELLRRSHFYIHLALYVAIGNYVVCDGAWRNEGDRFLTRFTDRIYLTILEMAFNYSLSEKRVLAENFYARLHMLFPCLNLWTSRLDKLDVFVRCFSIFTNFHIRHQSPLRVL